MTQSSLKMSEYLKIRAVGRQYQQNSKSINHINPTLKQLFHVLSRWNKKNIVSPSDLITQNDEAKPKRDN